MHTPGVAAGDDRRMQQGWLFIAFYGIVIPLLVLLAIILSLLWRNSRRK